ncbi:hypothetical protein S2091_0657 [Solimicrobium silvestre]|uniref:Uncharacterized protein n=1 Tax=Solimicrobium silvestre TaxID=2099400 RepID=A0A2S9H3U1_9BURK|nr:hypothetical protein S2091_0657 [Solimicrobium silvestre]
MPAISVGKSTNKLRYISGLLPFTAHFKINTINETQAFWPLIDLVSKDNNLELR